MFFVELNEIGWNLLTVSSAVIMIITTRQYWDFYLQSREIWRKKSTESISLSFVIIIFFTLVASIYYGIVTRSLVITYTSGCALPYLFGFIGAMRYGNPKLVHWALVVLGAGLLLSFLLPIPPATVFGAFATLATLPLITQLRELYKPKATRGVVRGSLLVTFAVKNFFLTLFGFLMDEPVYSWFGLGWIVLTVWLCVRWWQLPPKK